MKFPSTLRKDKYQRKDSSLKVNAIKLLDDMILFSNLFLLDDLIQHLNIWKLLSKEADKATLNKFLIFRTGENHLWNRAKGGVDAYSAAMNELISVFSKVKKNFNGL